MPTLLFLDFGTAYSKAATCKSGEPPVALAIGNAVQQRVGDPHMIRTALFISRSGEVCFGEAAIDTAAAEERQPYDAIKDVLTNAKHRSELDEMLPDNPTGQPLSKRQAITLFLAFFVRAALRAHEAPEEVRLSVAMPVFAKDKQRWVSDELTACLTDAYVLAEHFRNTMFRSIDLRETVRVLNQAGRPQVVADPPTIVGASAPTIVRVATDRSTARPEQAQPFAANVVASASPWQKCDGVCFFCSRSDANEPRLPLFDFRVAESRPISASAPATAWSLSAEIPARSDFRHSQKTSVSATS